MAPTDPADTPPGPSPMQVKVVIIGAGACGLQCAHDLVARHRLDPKDLLVLEARDRVGGRIHTAREARARPDTGERIAFALDHGACWVHGTGLPWGAPVVPGSRDPAASPSAVDDPAGAGADSGANPILPLLAEAARGSPFAQLDPVFQGNPWVRPRAVVHRHRAMALYLAGRRIDTEPSLAPLVEASLQRHFDRLGTVSRMGQELYRTGRGMDTVHRSVGEVLEEAERRSGGVSTGHSAPPGVDVEDTIQSLAPFYMHLLECWHGSSVRDLQLGAFVADDPMSGTDCDSEYVCVGDFHGPHCNVRQGMETILEPLLRDGVRERIHLKQEVTKVRYVDGQRLILETATGLCIRADACVSTLTAECLKVAVAESMFEPGLDKNKQEAISFTQMGSYKKVFLTFDSVFWPTDEPFLGLVQHHAATTTSPLGNFLLINNLWAKRGVPCLEAILFAESGQWATGKSDQEIRTAVLAFMEKTMDIDDDLEKLCTGIHVTRWEEDRFSRGAYSNDCLGATIRHLEELRRPEYDGRLLLAGEATIPEFQGSVHAALFSGRDSADHIAAVLSKRMDASAPTRSDHEIRVATNTIQYN